MRSLPFQTAAFLATLSASCLVHAAPTYTLVDLGLGSARSINAAGKVVGNGPTLAWLFDGITRTNLTFRQATLNGPSGFTTDWPNLTAAGINDAGVIAGMSQFPFGNPGIPFPFRYAGGSNAVVLGSEGSGEAINSAGVMVGGRGRSAFLFDGVTLSRFASPGAVPLAINNAGVVAGFDTAPVGSDGKAARFVGGATQLLDLSAIPNPTGLALWSEARGINSHGAIVGEGIKDGVQRAFLLQPAPEILPPSITRQPASTSVFAGDPFSLSVLASGDGPFTYQWRHSGTNLPGATSDVLTVTKAGAADAGPYQVIVSNQAGATSSSGVQVEVKIRPELTLKSYAGLTVTGVVGRNYRIDAALDPQGPWAPVGTLKLEVSPSFWLDFDSPQNPLRVYRAVEVP